MAKKRYQQLQQQEKEQRQQIMQAKLKPKGKLMLENLKK